MRKSVMLLLAGVALTCGAREDKTSETCLYGDMRAAFPKFRKCGAVCSCGEASPFVFGGRRLRMELYDPTRGTDPSDARICCRIRDVEAGKILSAFGQGCYYPSAWTDGRRVCVTATRRTFWQRGENVGGGFCGETVVLFESTDLVRWTERELFSRRGWRIYNTTLTRGPEGFVLAYECSRPDCTDFTMFFAKSPDLTAWTLLEDAWAYPAKRYSGGPFLRYHNGFYYLSLVTALPCRRYCTYLFRTKDFAAWEVGRYNPLLSVTEEDRRIAPDAQDIPDALRARIPTAFVCSLADVEMCDWNGKTWINYGIGDQQGFYYWAEAWYDGPMGELFENFFR